jgi:hypothetical protein
VQDGTGRIHPNDGNCKRYKKDTKSQLRRAGFRKVLSVLVETGKRPPSFAKLTTKERLSFPVLNFNQWILKSNNVKSKYSL